MQVQKTLQVCTEYIETLGCEVCSVVQFNIKDGQNKKDDVICFIRDVDFFRKI